MNLIFSEKTINILIFIFFLTLLSFDKGYSYIPIFLGSLSIIYSIILFKNKKCDFSINKNDKQLIYSLLFYFATFLISIIINGDKIRELDTPAKILLLIPSIVLLSHFKLEFKTIIHGIPLGACVAGLVALYQKVHVGYGRAFISYMSIQAGDIAMTLTLLTIAITFYLHHTNSSTYLIMIYILSAVLGLTASGLSNARGGWIAIPIILTFLIYQNRKIGKKFLSLVMISIFSIISLLYFIPQTSVADKIHHITTQSSSYFNQNNANTSIGARFDMWKSAIFAIKEKPILGWGMKNYIEHKKEQAKNKIISENTIKFNDAHNQYLDSFVKRGIIGFLGLMAIFSVPFYYFYTKLHSQNKIIHLTSQLGVIHILCTMIYSLTQSFLNHSSGAIFYSFMIILFYSIVKYQNKHFIEAIPPQN